MKKHTSRKHEPKKAVVAILILNKVGLKTRRLSRIKRNII